MFHAIGGPILDSVIKLEKDFSILAEKSKVELPELSLVTSEYPGGIELPVTGQTESMEATITKVGIDVDMPKLLTPESKNIVITAAQDTLQVDGSVKPSGIRAKLRVIPKGIPGITIELGSASENDIPLSVTRYELFIDNVPIWCIDKLANLYIVNGKDYAKSVQSLL